MTTTQITIKEPIILSEIAICEKYNVTPAQLDKASRQIDMSNGAIFYQVSSQTTDEIYEVRHNGHNFTCTCKAGKVGVPCWHIRAAIASACENHQQERLSNYREMLAQEAANARYAELEAQKQ